MRLGLDSCSCCSGSCRSRACISASSHCANPSGYIDLHSLILYVKNNLWFCSENEEKLHFARTMLYLKNQLFAFALLFAFVEYLDFLTVHHLFGPWAIIIR